MKPSGIVLIVGLVLALGLITGTLWAYAQGDGFDIHACVNPSGKIRIVDDVSMCKEQETELEWNIEGPQGEPGPQGVLGFYTRDSGFFLVRGDSTGGAAAECDAGDYVTGGGYVLGSEVCLRVIDNTNTTQDTWGVTVLNICAADHKLSVRAVCADMTPED